LDGSNEKGIAAARSLDAVGNKEAKEKMMKRKTKYPDKDSNDPRARKAATWVREQREAYKEGRLTEEQVRQFELLPDWSWDEQQR
jgi:hypothetical protein